MCIGVCNMVCSINLNVLHCITYLEPAQTAMDVPNAIYKTSLPHVLIRFSVTVVFCTSLALSSRWLLTIHY